MGMMKTFNCASASSWRVKAPAAAES